MNTNSIGNTNKEITNHQHQHHHHGISSLSSYSSPTLSPVSNSSSSDQLNIGPSNDGGEEVAAGRAVGENARGVGVGVNVTGGGMVVGGHDKRRRTRRRGSSVDSSSPSSLLKQSSSSTEHSESESSVFLFEEQPSSLVSAHQSPSPVSLLKDTNMIFPLSFESSPLLPSYKRDGKPVASPPSPLKMSSTQRLFRFLIDCGHPLGSSPTISPTDVARDSYEAIADKEKTLAEVSCLSISSRTPKQPCLNSNERHSCFVREIVTWTRWTRKGCCPFTTLLATSVLPKPFTCSSPEATLPTPKSNGKQEEFLLSA